MSTEQNGSKAGTPSPERLDSDMELAAIKLRSAVGMNITVRARGMTQRQIDCCWEVIDIIEKHFPNAALSCGEAVRSNCVVGTSDRKDGER